MVRMWLPEPPTDVPLDEVQPLDDIVIPGTDTSDTEDEENQYDGYEPLPLGPTENDNEQSSGGEDDYEDAIEHTFPSTAPGAGSFPLIEPIDKVLVQEVWSGPAPQHVDIEMDPAKANEVKQAMANFTLPSSSIPDWAANIPEEQWKEQLTNRIQSWQEHKVKK